MTTRICFVRHGETDWNTEKRIQGQIDIPLNATGLRQVQALGQHAARFPFAAIYSSDLERAMTTAGSVARHLGLQVQALPDLRERHFGIFQGLTAAEGGLAHPQAHARHLARDPHYDFETGETLLAFARRVVAGVDALVRRHPGQTLCAVSHGGVLDILYRKATGRPLDTPRDFSIPNCALNWFHFDAQGWHLETWGDRGHLQQALEEVAE